MADRKISDLTALTAPASGDYLPIVDISEASAANKNKRITIEELLRGAPDGTAAAPGIGFESDPNTGIYRPGADQLAIATGGAGRLFIDSSGNVGVGATPAAAFSVSSSAFPLATFKNTSASTANNISFLNNVDAGFSFITYGSTYSGGSTLAVGASGSAVSATNDLGVNAGNTLRFGTGNTERARIDSSGRLGVGTSSPDSILTINTLAGGAPTYRGDIVLNQSGGASGFNANGGIEFKIDGTSNGYGARILQAFNGISAYNFAIQTRNNSATWSTRLLIDSSGNVGIGTTSPTQKLQITDGTLSNFYVAPGYGSGSGTLIGVGGSEYLAFATNGLANERARIDSSGRLLVGTSSNSGGALLQVNDNRIRIATAKTPASASDTGTAGEVCWDANYVYVCTATNTWKRTAIATW